MKNENLEFLLNSNSLFLKAIGTCEAHKRLMDYPTANKYFAVALSLALEQNINDDSRIFVEGNPNDYYGLLHVGTMINGSVESVCCPIPMLNNGYRNLAMFCEKIERRLHCRVFNGSAVDNLLNLSEDCLQKYYDSVFDHQIEVEELEPINLPESVGGEIVQDEAFDPWEE